MGLDQCGASRQRSRSSRVLEVAANTYTTSLEEPCDSAVSGGTILADRQPGSRCDSAEPRRERHDRRRCAAVSECFFLSLKAPLLRYHA